MKRSTLISLLVIIAAAAFLRFWQLADHPPGWRDDELINSLVISQHAIDGDFRLFYDDASGHEGLYHILNAGPLALFGPSAAGIRWLSAVMGVQTVIMTFFLGRELFERDDIGLIAAAGLTVSFWSLMYSRIGLRHVSLLFFVLPAFYFLWRAIRRNSRASAIWSGAFLGFAFYTYFASRGVPLIIAAWLLYLLLFNRRLIIAAWGKTWLVLAIGIALAIPLAVALQQQPEAEARVAELAVPIVEARAGNFAPLAQFTWRTLNMFHGDGDDEFLYNIPGRPVFGPLTALVFWLGVAIALRQTLGKRPLSFDPDPAPYGFVLLWWAAGIAPAFISVPPASLSHTILAQPAVYLLLGVGAVWLWELMAERVIFRNGRVRPANNLLSLLSLLSLIPLILITLLIAGRDLPAYFVDWPARGNVRFLYRADLHDVARAAQNDQIPSAFGVTSQLLGPWDRLALDANLARFSRDVETVLFDPGRAIPLQPNHSWIGFPVILTPFEPAVFETQGPAAGGYQLATVDPAAVPQFEADHCFANGLCLAPAVNSGEDPTTLDLLITVARPPDFPLQPLISNPPPPNVYAGPRLLVFAQLLDETGQFIIGDDALGVDMQTLEPGQRFWQRHRFAVPEGVNPATMAFGLYDPMTGARIATVEGQTAVEIPLK